MFNPIEGFRDPVRRPRYIIWSALAVMLVVLMWTFGLVGTSFSWFCETPCHIVHDDNTLAYNAGTHSNVSCIACHEPVNSSPIQFTVLKIFVIPDLYATITKTFDLPMNARNEVALEKFPNEQCWQCHNMNNREVSPSPGMKINHDAHTTRGVLCTMCHNRVAHPEENITLVLEGDEKHENWTTMTACFRCHSQDPKSEAPGACDACHTADFNLVPASHEATNWFNPGQEPFGHSAAAKEAADAAAAGKALEDQHSEPGKSEETSEGVTPEYTSSRAINECYTCHLESFCNDCHKKLRPTGATSTTP
jgi:hypothetical protein